MIYPHLQYATSGDFTINYHHGHCGGIFPTWPWAKGRGQWITRICPDTVDPFVYPLKPPSFQGFMVIHGNLMVIKCYWWWSTNFWSTFTVCWKITILRSSFNSFDWAIFKFATCNELPEGHMGGSINGGTPSHHPFLDGIFPNKNQPFFGGPPMTMEIPICIIWGTSIDLRPILDRPRRKDLLVKGWDLSISRRSRAQLGWKFPLGRWAMKKCWFFLGFTMESMDLSM